MGVFHYVRPWMFGFILAGIPVATYTWMIYTRPDVYSQVGRLPEAGCSLQFAPDGGCECPPAELAHGAWAHGQAPNCLHVALPWGHFNFLTFTRE